jgi:hypothetical protein
MAWRYTGLGQPRPYQDYVDTATGRLLVAQEGGVYEIRAVSEGLPVPPADGWWKPEPPDGAESTVDVPESKTPRVRARGRERAA